MKREMEFKKGDRVKLRNGLKTLELPWLMCRHDYRPPATIDNDGSFEVVDIDVVDPEGKIIISVNGFQYPVEAKNFKKA